MKRLAVYTVLFPLVCVHGLLAMGAGVPHMRVSDILFVCGAAFIVMLLPALIVWAVERFLKRYTLCAIAGFLSVPATLNGALYAMASPRLWESLLFGIIGLVAATVCNLISRKVQQGGTAGD
jgi:hypothetical protein